MRMTRQRALAFDVEAVDVDFQDDDLLLLTTPSSEVRQADLRSEAGGTESPGW